MESPVTIWQDCATNKLTHPTRVLDKNEWGKWTLRLISRNAKCVV